MRNPPVYLPLAVVFLLTACGGGGDAGTGTHGNEPGSQADDHAFVAAVRNTAPVANCPTGGITLQSGGDNNGNGLLDASEVRGTHYVCNGAAGAGGVNALALAVPEPAGANCPAGGNRITAGSDTNGNGALEIAEVSATSYVCSGVGTSGLDTRVSVVAEAAGANCENGGSKLTSGLDANRNGLLDAAEITTTSFVCHGASADALNTLVSVIAEPAGANCPNGGSVATSGSDVNRNSTLDASEVTTTSYICNGASGVSTLMSLVAEAPGANCASGGSRMTSGLDANRNNVLDATEVTATNYACNGGNGADGLNTLVSVVAEPGGANCANGGSRMTSGLDANRNDVLDAGEITTTTRVCNGASGNNGLSSLTTIVAEPAGPNCEAGGSIIRSGPDADRDGILDAGEISATGFVCNGANGFNTLMSIVAESAGANCAFGGSRINTGLDADRSNTLDAGEVSATSYVCSGAPGPGLTWQYVTAASVQAASNTGYLVDNPARVTVTLPATPAIGDVIKVSGAGLGGWKIAQNAGQSIITRYITHEFGVSWRPALVPAFNISPEPFQDVASSADGMRLIAGRRTDTVYISHDGGQSWTPSVGVGNWVSVASSADGTKLAAVNFAVGVQMQFSADSGDTWEARGPSRTWVDVASSADGTKLVAVTLNDQIFTSADSGVSWTPRESIRSWRAVASSADGTRLAAATPDAMYISTDSGVTWTPHGAGNFWTSVASSADGMRLIAVASAQLYMSTDGGTTWTPRAEAGVVSYVASSADGTRLIAGRSNAMLSVSMDSGETWVPRASSLGWRSVGISGDGTRLFAGDTRDVFISAPTTTPGIAGSISGPQYSAVELQYIGNGQFMALNHEGSFAVE